MCHILLQNYAAALQIYTELVDKDEPNKANLLSGIGRIYLQVWFTVLTLRCGFQQNSVLICSVDFLSADKLYMIRPN